MAVATASVGTSTGKVGDRATVSTIPSIATDSTSSLTAVSLLPERREVA